MIMPTTTMVLIGAMIYTIPAIAAYSSQARNSNYIWLVGLLCTLLADIIWIYVTKKTNDNQQIFLYAFYWELTYKLAAIFIPMLVFGVKMSMSGYVGILLILVGTMLIHLGVSA